jgi:hypothetical protein
VGLLCTAGCVKNTGVADQLDRVAKLVEQGDWSGAKVRYDEICDGLKDEDEKAGCHRREDRIFALQGTAPAAPAPVAAAPAPAAPPAPIAAAPVPAIAPAPAAAPAPAPAPPPAAGFMSLQPQPNAFAIAIGIEQYSANLPPPTGARADAQSFASMATSSLGIARDHLQLLTDAQATKGGIEKALAWAQGVVPPGGRIYFYFSGHGAPDASSGTSYVVPYDGDPKYIDATGIPIRDILSKLGQSKAKEVLAMVDSCFSGAGGRSVLPPGARPLVRVKEENAPAQLAFYSASTGSEISGPVPGGSGGLFTKYVLDGLGNGSADINGDGQVSLGELSQWVGPRVARAAKNDNRDQNPSLTVGRGLGTADSFIVEWGLPSR